MAYTNIDDPSAYFQTKIYTGTNNSNALTNDGNSDLQPDFIWIKRRNYNNGHQLLDSTRGVDKILGSELSSAETTLANRLSSFDTDGFTVESSSGAFNASGETFVAWQWKANGGTTSSNTDGNTTTTVQANQDGGFSIVTYTGTASASQTMGHGMGVTPNIIITKRRDGSANWSVNGNVAGLIYGTNKFVLNGNAALTADTNEVTAASSTTFTGGGSNAVNGNGSTYVAYCFAEKQGYSKFGSYAANYANDGTFVYTGFKPAWVMIKNTAHATNWIIIDAARNPNNVANLKLGANNSAGDNGSDLGNTSQNNIDLLSNGFKLRTGNTDTNYNVGNKLIYMAFAENPFVTSTGIPTTAR